MVITHDTPALVVGAGPAGMILALRMARFGIKCMLVERNLSTTKWPKMDIVNARSMEMLRRMGIDHGPRTQGVPQTFAFDTYISTGLSDGGQAICKWDLPSPNAWRERIKRQNDGSMPREPYQRCMQALFEAWLRPVIEAEPLIDSHWGLKFESLVETDDGVESKLIDSVTGDTHIVNSQYVAGCDGAGSRVRKSFGSELIGGPTPAALYLVHFKSRDLFTIQKQGLFSHIFFTNGAALVAMDEIDTWTGHLPVSLGTDVDKMDPKEAINAVLGGSAGPCPVDVDDVLVSSVWRPNVCVAERYKSAGGRVFIAGDAAHQQIPTGAYGMNTAIADSFDLGWKLAAVLGGYGGEHLLESYEAERKPVAVRNIGRSAEHFKLHREYCQWIEESGGPAAVIAQTLDGAKLRARIASHMLTNDGENKDHGVEFGYRYNNSPVVIPDTEAPEPEWNLRSYVPTTWPGTRAPHVFLKDGTTSIFDLFGTGYTLVDFSEKGSWAADFLEAGVGLSIPLKPLLLPDETHVRGIWGRDAVLVRPDDHVAWRAPVSDGTTVDAAKVLRTAVGLESSALLWESLLGAKGDAIDTVKENGFVATVGNVNQDKVESKGAFQL